MKKPAIAVLLLLLLAGCGQAGPLVLPDAPPEAQQPEPQKKDQ